MGHKNGMIFYKVIKGSAILFSALLLFFSTKYFSSYKNTYNGEGHISSQKIIREMKKKLMIAYGKDFLPKINQMIENNELDIIFFSSLISDKKMLEITEAFPALSIKYKNYSQELMQKNDNLFRSYNHNQIKTALTSPNSRFLWAMRGGYGSMKLLNDHEIVEILSPRVSDFMYRTESQDKDKDFIPDKVLIGFSDLTYLMLATYQNLGWRNIHADVFSQVLEGGTLRDANNIKIVYDIIQGKVKEIKIPMIHPVGHNTMQLENNVEGWMTGGNLEMVLNTLGTPYEIKTEGAILMLEDINIKPYQLARGLNHLLQAGKFSNVAAVVFGSFSCVSSGCSVEEMRKIIKEFADGVNFPVYMTDNFGHEKTNYPWIYGANAVVERHEGSARIIVKVMK